MQLAILTVHFSLQPCCENTIKVAIQSTVPMFSTPTHLCVVSLTVTGLTGICSPASGQMMVEGCDSQTQSYLGSSLPWDAGTGQLELQLVQDVPADTELCECIGLSPISATVYVYAQVFLHMFGVVCSYVWALLHTSAGFTFNVTNPATMQSASAVFLNASGWTFPAGTMATTPTNLAYAPITVCAHILARTHSHARTLVHLCTYAHSHIHVHTHVYVHVYMHACTRPHDPLFDTFENLNLTQVIITCLAHLNISHMCISDTHDYLPRMNIPQIRNSHTREYHTPLNI